MRLISGVLFLPIQFLNLPYIEIMIFIEEVEGGSLILSFAHLNNEWIKMVDNIYDNFRIDSF